MLERFRELASEINDLEIENKELKSRNDRLEERICEMYEFNRELKELNENQENMTKSLQAQAEKDELKTSKSDLAKKFIHESMTDLAGEIDNLILHAKDISEKERGGLSSSRCLRSDISHKLRLIQRCATWITDMIDGV